MSTPEFALSLSKNKANSNDKHCSSDSMDNTYIGNEGGIQMNLNIERRSFFLYRILESFIHRRRINFKHLDKHLFIRHIHSITGKLQKTNFFKKQL